MNKNVVYSYLRHLLITAGGIALAVVKAKHIPLLHLTKTDLLTVANAVWLAILPQLRFAVQPLVNTYLKKKFPTLGLSLSDFVAASTPTQTVSGDTLLVAPQTPVTPPQNVVFNISTPAVTESSGTTSAVVVAPSTNA